jgi:glycosyltransferase involved in cell wall biosynthesis
VQISGDIQKIMKFSVIICTYNDAHFLGDALRTVAAQSFSDFELLIVDDGSTDNTEEVVERLSHPFRNLIYLRKPHTGLPDSRNFGIQAASGTHIAYLDADDFWAPEYLEAMRGAFERIPQAEMVCCDGFHVGASGEVFGPIVPAGLPPVCGRLNTAQELFSFFPYVSPTGLIYAKAAYGRIGPVDTRYPLMEDWHWLIRAVQRGTFCVRLDRKLILHRTHGANMSSNVDGVLRDWLSAHMDLWRQKPEDPEVEFYARKMTRKYIPALLAGYSGAECRCVLDEAIQAHGNDSLLPALRFLTYLGLCRQAKWARGIKRALRKLSPQGPRIDLQGPPERLFAGIYYN